MTGTCPPPRRLQAGDYLKGPIPRERPVAVCLLQGTRIRRLSPPVSGKLPCPRRFALAWIEAKCEAREAESRAAGRDSPVHYGEAARLERLQATCHFLQLTSPSVRLEWPEATGVAASALHVFRGNDEDTGDRRSSAD